MPIKSFTFAFKLDAKELLEYVVSRNIALDIHATGTKRELPAPEQTQQPPEQMLALPAPPNLSSRLTDSRSGKKANGLNSRGIVMLFLAQHQEERVSAAGLRDLITQSGYKPSSIGGLLFDLRKYGWVKQAGKGYYRITAKGLQQMEAE